jgi:serine/threonine protein kinase
MPETTQFGNTTSDGRTAHIEGTLKSNTILMNRYKILGVLGGGGQGAVYSARDMNFEVNRMVAIKEMRHQSGDANVRAVALNTFQREANILALLTHPTIPKIYDFFDDSDNRFYLVMEYINGSDLEALLSKTKELPIDKIIEWAIDLCDVLQYLHLQKPEPIIFRDMKPANIMIDSLGKARLIDFGIAKKFISGVKNTMIGTEGYCAPEQYKGDVNPRSDIYGLGATIHHIITRKDPRIEQPFSFSERPIKSFNPAAPDFLQKILDRALEMDAKQRYQTCEEMKQDLLLLRAKMTSGHTASVSSSSTDAKRPDHTSFFDDDASASSSYGPRWTFKTEDEIRGGVAVFKDKVLVGSYDTNLWAINVETGEFLWKYATLGGIATTPVVDKKNGLVLFGSEDHHFYALDIETGRVSWKHVTSGRIRSSPCLAHDHVFFGNDDGHLYAIACGSGRLLWETDLGAEIRTRPYVTNDRVFVGAESGELFCLELSGARKWSVDVSKRGRAISSSPYIDETDGIGYVGCFDGNLYAVDVAGSGYVMWRFRTMKPIVSSVAVDNGVVYFGSVDGSFYAVNADSGKEKWRFTIDKPIVATPAVFGDKVYFGGSDGIFYCLETKNGKESWRYETGNAITGTPYIIDNKLILVGSMDYSLYAFPLVG